MGKKKRAGNKKGTLALTMQTVISIAYAAMLVHMTILLVRSRSTGWISTIVAYFPHRASNFLSLQLHSNLDQMI